MDWIPISQMPEELKDGRPVALRQWPCAPAHARWRDGKWRFTEYQHPARPTHYAIITPPEEA